MKVMIPHCPICGQVVTTFKDQLSFKEWEISGICQGCQDEIFDDGVFDISPGVGSTGSESNLYPVGVGAAPRPDVTIYNCPKEI